MVPYRFRIGSRHGKINIPINTQEVRRQQPTYFTACLLLAYTSYSIAIQYCRSLRQFIDSSRCLIHRAAHLPFLPFFFSRFSFLFFNVSVVDTCVVGLFVVCPGVNELSTRMSVMRWNDSAQSGMSKKKDLLTGYVSIVTFCDDNSYS